MAATVEKEDQTFDRETIMRELNEKGYTVIPDVCSAHDCEQYVSEFQRFIDQFEDDEWPFQMNSIIQSYMIGHFESTWKARIKAKSVFASVWETEKLLTSIDGVAISYPPEKEKYGVWDTGHDWLHVDQAAERSGLHAYQGALYLEEATEKDYCFRVLSGSHNHLDSFYEEFSQAAKKSNRNDFYKLQPHEKEWFRERGCLPTKVSVPKGGMVLWDSRTVHDNCRPVQGRPNSDRWRYVVFVCMAPAQWARPEDMIVKKKAYENRLMTSHWPAQEINIFSDFTPPHSNKIHVPVAKKHSPVALTDEVRLLAGDLEYDFQDGRPNGPSRKPKWNENTNIW